MRKTKRSSGKLNLLLLIVTLISSALTGLGMHYSHGIAALMERSNRLFMPLYMAALFVVFWVVTSLLVFLISNMKLTFRADVISGRRNKGRIFLYILIGVLLIGLLLLGAEYLYEMNFQRGGKKAAGTYVFLIDDSASMEISDPASMRYSVIENTLKDKPGKTQYAVYSFSNSCELCVPMRRVEDGFTAYPAPEYGVTYMEAGLERVISDCEQGVWTANKDATLIMITDGSPTDFGTLNQVQPILDRYVKQGIQIGIVGVVGADNELMHEIATYTGGSFTDINDTGLMNEAVRGVSGNAVRTRDLLSERDTVQMAWIYALLRVLTFALAGSLMAIGAALCYGNNTVFNFIVWVNVAKAVLAGVLMEVAFVLPAADTVLQLIAWILLGTIIARCGDTEEPEWEGSGYIDFFETPINERRPSRYH